MRKLFCDGSFYSPEGYKAAMLVEEGRIARLYDEAEPLPQELERVPLGGAWVYPAFCDTHTHCFEGGLYSAGADLSGVKSITDLLDLLREALRELQRGETLFAWKFDESAIREARFPSQAELDKLTDDKSIVLRRIDGHSAMLNARARAELGAKISSESVLRGADNDTAVHHFHHNQSEDAILRAYHKAAEIALKGGFGSVHTMIGDAAESITHYGLIHRHLSHFAIDYVLYPQSFNLEAAMAEGAKRIGGCILADGSIGSRTAALSLPYEGKAESGALYRSDSFWQGWVKAAHEKDLQVAVHCIGDRAIRQINEAYRLAQAAKPGDFRHQLIHCELCTDELLDEIAASGACAVMQPAFDRYWGNPGGL